MNETEDLPKANDNFLYINFISPKQIFHETYIAYIKLLNENFLRKTKGVPT